MIPEYKFYHGAVLAELVDQLPRPISIDELTEDGRLSSYVFDGRIGVHIKHSSARIHPWQFTFTESNLIELRKLRDRFAEVFAVFVCESDGMVCLSLAELDEILTVGESDQAGVRIDRRPGQWYSVSAGGSTLSSKKPSGLDLLIDSLAAQEGIVEKPHLSFASPDRNKESRVVNGKKRPFSFWR